MKNILLSTCIVCCVLITSSELLAQGITTPRTASPAASVSQTIGISTVTVKYSRPSVKARKIWGELVPFGWTAGGPNGPTPWRAGANENTVIEFSDNAMVAGKPVPAGKYGLFLVINEDNTGEVILSKDHRSWGAFTYNPAADLLRAPIQTRDHEMTETLTYDFMNLEKNSGELVLNWEKKQFPIKIEFAVDEIVLANAADELRSVVGFQWQGFASAAAYAAANNLHLDQALIWADRALAMNKAFATLQIKANVLRRLNRVPEADQVMKEAVTLANEAELNNYAYVLLNRGQIDQAIELFQLNVTRFPKSANAFDSLGEGYVMKGDKSNAIKNFKKALSMNPPDVVKTNSEKFLKELGAM